MDSLSKAPRYREVRRQIIDSLARGQWKPGDTLPTERELADRFGVAISTIRAGLAELTTTGVLVRRQGKGTFVAHHNTGPQQFRYSNVYTDDGTKLSTIRVVRSMERVRADAVTAARLKLHTGNARHVYRVEATLQSADGKAIAAMELATLANLAPGRLLAGIGHGVQEWMEQMGARTSSPLTTLEEVITVVRRLLHGDTVTFEGREVSMRDVALDAPPSEVPPLLAGVRGPKSLALAGRVADGVVLAEGAGPTYCLLYTSPSPRD